jgi:voltage-gated potassium channel
VVLLVVLGGGTLGYIVIGLSPLDALYQTVTTVSTVGFRELFPQTASAKVFTIVLILTGVGTVLYAFGVVLEAVIEGDLFDVWGRRRMERTINQLKNHIVVCGYGRVGRAVAANLAAAGEDFVIVDQDAERFADVEYLNVTGDATDDEVLRRAGIERARALVAATSTDTTNVYLTLSGRALKPDLFIVGRARIADSESKLLRAGADRVINPQAIGGSRIAALLMQPHVAEFLDVVTHEEQVEFRLAEVPVPDDCPLANRSLRATRLRERTGALVLALRDANGQFATNPGPDTVVTGGDVLIVIGTSSQIEDLITLAAQTDGAA